MTNKETLKKQIIYRSLHRGSKEMDILLGNFVKKHIDSLDSEDLNNLKELLLIEDDILYNWYFNKNNEKEIPKNKVSEKLKNFKF